LCLHFPEVRQSIEFANATCPPDAKMPYPMHHQFFPPPLLEPEAFARIERELAWSTRTTHGMMAANLATWYLVRSMGIRPDVVAGFSLGEWSALVAGGVIPVDNLLECANMAMGSYSDEWTDNPNESWGAWGMVVAPVERVEPVLQQVDGTVCITMDISPNQVFIGGEIEAVRAALQKLKAEGIWGQELPFPAVHTPLAGEMVERLKAEKSKLRAHKPQCTIYRGVCGTPYPDDPDQILDLLFDSVTHPVSIRNTISRLYDDGVRVFIQLGGGGRLLPNIRSTLQGYRTKPLPLIARNAAGWSSFIT
jgi:acyl transferase domain-containing protein